MALTYGKNVQGMKPGEWMTSADYKKLFDNNGELPKELRNAIDKYMKRVRQESAERSSKVARLAEHIYTMKQSKKGLSKGQIDEIVKLISDVDGSTRVNALDLPQAA